jgi:hypothetical protein
VEAPVGTDGMAVAAFLLDVEAVLGTVAVAIRVAESAATLVQLELPVDAPGEMIVPFSAFPANPGVDFASVERLFVRIGLGAGESIVLGGIRSVATDILFRHGFED